MHSIFSISIDAGRWAGFARDAAREFDADLFLTGGGYPGEDIGWVCIAPVAVLHIDKHTGSEDISRFTFNKDGPAFGFFSYEYGMLLRGIRPATATNFPLGCLKKYRVFVRHVRTKRTAEVFAADAVFARTIIQKLCSAEQLENTFPISTRGTDRPVPSMSQREYMEDVEKTLEFIRSGCTYQLNLSIRFSLAMKNAGLLDRFFHLFSTRPAPFYAWFKTGDHTILSTSPELFLRVVDGEVLSKPIKGTYAFNDYSPDLVRKLTDSDKESAELSMIVDLIRNDISHHCEYGSVRVENHKSVFAVSKLLQMYSEVKGRLKDDSTCMDLLFDAFPGGSITGCPKHSSMRIIRELEPHSRDIYCGSFVIIHDEKNMDSSIAIRTGFHDQSANRFDFFAGSGIVVDSDPEKEYLETMAKTNNFSTFFTR